MMNLALSKVVLFIVEGETDELALGAPLNKLFSSFNSSEFRFRVTRGDLITNRSYGSECSPNNVKKRVVEQVKIFLGRYKLKWSDLAAIVYLTDTDGTFIAASSVVQNDVLNGISYFLDHVESPYSASIVSRNDNKSACLKVLCRSGHLTYSGQRVAFKTCYMSRNLEHALHGRVEKQILQQKLHCLVSLPSIIGCIPRHSPSSLPILPHRAPIKIVGSILPTACIR